MREMRLIANNIANASTTGYRQQGIVFSEYIRQTDLAGSLSMPAANIQNTSYQQGTLTQTGGQLDVGIEGEGFFLVAAPQGERLTRAGAFALSSQGDLVTQDGYPVLDAGGAPLFVPPDASDLAIAQDGTLSTQGRPIGQLGLVRPLDAQAMVREGGVLFRADAGFEPLENPTLRQGFVESSNVDPILQVARMIEVQRAYEMGQSFLEREDERIRTAIKSFTR
ncbi:Flagellar basal-body rod protein FlgG [Salipiger mucosus DSM 16094]|uniref:Flagellar basal-body rod protein FlgF n=2 Tax=Salipiger mucosus TaxID=263378 RepID=S9S8R5_9RHOB|nr:Flagellar basal-body rod protein FlgG [Salipiger mucosus DSM 16094]